MIFDNIKELIQIVDESTLSKFELEVDGVVIKMEKNVPCKSAAITTASSPADYVLANSGSTKANSPEADNGSTVSGSDEFDNAFVVTAPIVGTFFSASSPEAAPFVNVGDKVKVGDTLCIIEAMKIMNEITSQKNGHVVAILVENGQMVEYGQPLLKIL